MKSLLSAFAFLTPFPVPVRWLDPEQDHAKCAKYFPLVGLVLGVMTAAVGEGALLLLPHVPAAVLITAVMVAVSGGLHLDGMADTADGFFSSRPREVALEIMRDSRVGTMGVGAMLFVMLLKVSLIAELLRASTLDCGRVLALSVFAGRCALLWSMRLNGYARSDGLGKSFWYRSSAASLLALVALCVLGSLLVGYPGLWGTAAAAGAVALLAIGCHRRIAGATGDTVGAGCELAETCFLLGVVAADPLGGGA